MSVLDARLDRLMPTLTAKERAILVIRADKAGTPEDPEVRRSLPREQLREFNRYLGLCYVANADLGIVLHVLSIQVERFENESYRLSELSGAADLLEKEMPEEVAKEPPVRGWRRRERITVPEFLRGVHEELRASLFRDARYRWQELRALETVWEDIAADFEGEDPVHPDLRAKLDETERRLRALIQELTPAKRTKKLPEPTEVLLAQYRGLVDRAFHQMGLLEEI